MCSSALHLEMELLVLSCRNYWIVDHIVRDGNKHNSQVICITLSSIAWCRFVRVSVELNAFNSDMELYGGKRGDLAAYLGNLSEGTTTDSS
jgi:hypothetical protein